MGTDQFRTSSPNQYNIPHQVSTEIEVIDLEGEDDNRPAPFRRPTPRRKQWLHEIAIEDYMRTRREFDSPVVADDEIPDIEEIDEVSLPKEFLTPFKRGFHREIVTGPREEQTKVYYITPGGIRIGNMKALKPYLKEFKDLGQKNFTFLPIALQIKDPLHKYQSIRPIPTWHQPFRCPQWPHEANFRNNTPGSPTRDETRYQPEQRGKTKLKRLMDIKIDISGLPRGYRWQIDQERRRQIEERKTSTTPEPHRSGDEERKQPKNHSQRGHNQQLKQAVPPKQPMMGIYKVIYKDKPPDDNNYHGWP